MQSMKTFAHRRLKLGFLLVLYAITLTNMSAIDQQQKEFVIVIPSYNNAGWYDKNIDSVLCQEYDTFEAIYIDDASTDGTADLVAAYLEKHDTKGKIRLIRNKERRGMLENRYKAFHSVAPHKILVELDGDDWYPHGQVLSRLNEEYQDDNVWLTFGQYQRMPNGSIGHSHPIASHVLDNQVYRQDGYYTSMLRTYYAGLYQNIALQDMLFSGKPFPVCTDLAAMYPMIEMAGNHARYINDVLYIVNRYNALNTENIFTDEDRRVFQRAVRQYKKPYTRLEKLDLTQNTAQTKTTKQVIFSENTPDQLAQALASACDHITGIHARAVIYTSDADNRDAYEQLHSQYPEVDFISIATNSSSFSRVVRDVCADHHYDYVLISGDDYTCTDSCDIYDCIDVMMQTKAHGFYLMVSKNKRRKWPERKLLPYFISLRDRDVKQSVYAWQFTGGLKQWLFPENLNMTLYSRETVACQLARIDFDSLGSLAYVWSRKVDLDSVGLCYGQAKVEINTQASPMKRIIWQDDSYDNACQISYTPWGFCWDTIGDLLSWFKKPFGRRRR